LNKHKKIISIVIKSLIGIASLAIIYFRLKSDLTEENLNLISTYFFSGSGILSVLICFVLIPLNWGLESYKWQLITAPIEKVSFKTAQQSVYSGICLGNLAPGRATEFLAKIIFFKVQNRPNITVLHFVNGMFQLSVTYIVGFIALAFKITSFGQEFMWIAYGTTGIAVVIVTLFVISLIKIDKVLHLVSEKISRKQNVAYFNYRFTAPLLIKLFGYSFLRFFVFFTQMLLLINLFTGAFSINIALSVALYFLITTTIPMISVLEPAIRAAIAFVVFSDTEISNTAVALASVFIWLFNIILPSAVGYIFLLKQNFDFNIRSLRK
jgi:heme exporter protein D